MPLSSVERIEKIKSTDIEDLGNRKVMQYRGGSLPLFAINDVAAVQPIADQDDLLVIVFKFRNINVGMLATGPVDTVDTNYSLDDTTLKQTGIKGSTILNKQTTMFVDIERTIEVIYPEWL